MATRHWRSYSKVLAMAKRETMKRVLCVLALGSLLSGCEKTEQLHEAITHEKLLADLKKCQLVEQHEMHECVREAQLKK